MLALRLAEVGGWDFGPGVGLGFVLRLKLVRPRVEVRVRVGGMVRVRVGQVSGATPGVVASNRVRAREEASIARGHSAHVHAHLGTRVGE